MENIQNYFTQVSIISGRIIEKDGNTEKIVDETTFDTLVCFPIEKQIKTLTNSLTNSFTSITEA